VENIAGISKAFEKNILAIPSVRQKNMNFL
jgi:hypothetical protein